MNKVGKVVKEHTMQIILVLVVIFFNIMTKGKMMMPANFSALINQNAYVYILATGMLMCMLIKGNIDLSVGSVVCFADAVGAVLMVKKGVPVFLAMLIMLIVGLAIAVLWVG